MGLLDRFALAVAQRIEKAPRLPAGSVTMNESDMRQVANNTSYGNTVELPRPSTFANVPFAPGMPLRPGAINPVRDDGRPDPRRYEFLVAQNINVTETRLVPFKTLRAAADQIDIVRRCIEVLKSKVLGLEWDITLGEDSTEKVMSESGVDEIRAKQIAKEKFSPEINRLKQFWEQPDPSNGLTFSDWIGMALEEILVLDAWAIWPQKSVGGDLIGLQILDGSTIKPLIDDRGMRPMAPYPAFQQILYGFPRSEFSAPEEAVEADGVFSSDELTYLVRNRRSMTVYGYSPVERSLPIADLYLRRQNWIRKEYTDGVLPELMFTTDANFGNNPDLLRAYENIFNDDLAGQTEQRMRARLLPQGLTPIQFEGYGEKFKETLDEYLVNSICGHFGIQPSEIGFSPKSGLGGAGHQQGQANSSEVIGLIPLTTWLSKMITNLSYIYLGMPRELEFRLMASNREETAEKASIIDTQIKDGQLTINEARSMAGRSLLDAPEADYPLVVAGTNTFFITPSGIQPIQSAAAVETSTPAVEAPKPEEKPAVSEVKSFLKWSRIARDRAFNFEHLEEEYAATLNKFILTGDLDGARWYAERYLGF
jgi:hypothetical protein